ncbi:hypothetical protein [uncultured Muribaculum sp.]|uniref:hypothetical protein n=1 Tax=uncultured Muribaculum sp. TaxID=1918613 RepID=UPI0025B179FC|nr:hypothetical protein [uncultured Muribaculum sp.]
MLRVAEEPTITSSLSMTGHSITNASFDDKSRSPTLAKGASAVCIMSTLHFTLLRL